MIAEELFPRYRCGTCKEAQKKERGCVGFEAPFPYWADLDGVEHSTCPRIPLMNSTQWFTTLLMYHAQYQKGFMPEPGGVNDQPGKFPELMTTLSYIINAVAEEKRNKRQPDKVASNGRGRTFKR